MKVLIFNRVREGRQLVVIFCTQKEKIKLKFFYRCLIFQSLKITNDEYQRDAHD